MTCGKRMIWEGEGCLFPGLLLKYEQLSQAIHVVPHKKGSDQWNRDQEHTGKASDFL